jgi:hypothetical protein
MFHRVFFPLVALFWITMNVLLWRAEFGGRGETGSTVSAEVVWQKILTAPDDSNLEVRWNGKRIGYCRWVANIGEERATGRIASEDYEPEGMVKQLTGYTIDLEGNLLAGEVPSRVRFSVHAGFATNHLWREFRVRVALRPGTWELETKAAAEELRLKYDDGGGELWARTFSYDELRNPRKLIEEMGGPPAAALLNVAAPLEQAPDLSLGLRWEARNDWLTIGHAQVRVYRLQARLLDRYQAVVLVSRVGEIMQVELPNGIRLVNEALTNF